MKRFEKPTDLNSYRKKLLKAQDPKKVRISVCGGVGCGAFGGQTLIKAFAKELKKRKLENEIEVTSTGCHGFCEKGPVVVIFPFDIFYQQVAPDDVVEII